MSKQDREPESPAVSAWQAAQENLDRRLKEDPDFLKRAGVNEQMYLSDLQHQYLLGARAAVAQRPGP